MKNIRKIPLSGKRAIVRVDFNVPLRNGKILDDYRIQASIPTLQYLLRKGASVILIAHLGRPEGYQKELSLEPVARLLTKALGQKIYFAKTLEEAGILSRSLYPRDILMLENIRFQKGETENSSVLAKKIATLGDVYINDAFGDSHRAHASIVGVPKYLPHAAGFLLEGEISVLGKVMKKPKRPLLAILGGAKISSKLPLLEYFLKNADAIITGGAMANTILAAQHVGVGKSLMDRTADLSWLKSKNKKIHLPVDATLTAAFDGKKPHRISGVRNIREDEIIADVGPDSIELFSALVRSSKTIVWNGPLGYAEVPAYAKGTEAMARALAKSKALTVIGGGDLTRIIRKLKLDKKITHISTGGGAMLEFLAGKKLPGIEALK